MDRKNTVEVRLWIREYGSTGVIMDMIVAILMHLGGGGVRLGKQGGPPQT